MQKNTLTESPSHAAISSKSESREFCRKDIRKLSTFKNKIIKNHKATIE